MANLLEAVFQAHHSRLLRYVEHIVGNRWAAEDLTQDVFLRLCKARRLRDPGAMTSWLYTVARNVSLDHLRRAQLECQTQLSVPEDPRTPLEHAEENELFGLVRRAIDRLGEHRRRTFELCALQGMDYATAAREMGCPTATVNTRMFRSWRRLRMAMQCHASEDQQVA